jgi:hypothetical protein
VQQLGGEKGVARCCGRYDDCWEEIKMPSPFGASAAWSRKVEHGLNKVSAHVNRLGPLALNSPSGCTPRSERRPCIYAGDWSVYN